MRSSHLVAWRPKRWNIKKFLKTFNVCQRQSRQDHLHCLQLTWLTDSESLVAEWRTFYQLKTFNYVKDDQNEINYTLSLTLLIKSYRIIGTWMEDISKLSALTHHCQRESSAINIYNSLPINGGMPINWILERDKCQWITSTEQRQLSLKVKRPERPIKLKMRTSG